MNHSGSKQPTSEKLTGEEIAKHDSRESCWVIIHGKAYDVTECVYNHIFEILNFRALTDRLQSFPNILAAPRSSSNMPARMPPKSMSPFTHPIHWTSSWTRASTWVR